MAEIKELEKEIKFLRKVIKAQDRLLISYRVGGSPPEWVFDTLVKFQKLEEDKNDPANHKRTKQTDR